MSEQKLREELDAVYRSTSWRITAPLRLFMGALKSLIYSIGSLKKSMISGHVSSVDPQAPQLSQNPAENDVVLKRADNMSDASMQILFELEAALKNKR